MKLALIPGIALVTTLVATSPASAQSIGFGGGLAIPASEVAQLPEEARQAGWSDVERRAERGYYIEARARFGSGLSFIAGASYNRFLEATSEYSDGSGRAITLISSQSIVPISIGFERTFGDGIIVPFGTLEGTMSYFYRSFETKHNETPVPIQLESSGEARYGIAAGLGASLDLPLIRFDLTGRMHFVNLFGSESTTEDLVYFLQLGATAYFGL